MDHDNKFGITGWGLKSLMNTYGIYNKPNNMKTRRVNAIVEIIHLTIGYVTRTDNFRGLHWQE